MATITTSVVGEPPQPGLEFHGILFTITITLKDEPSTTKVSESAPSLLSTREPFRFLPMVFALRPKSWFAHIRAGMANAECSDEKGSLLPQRKSWFARTLPNLLCFGNADEGYQALS
ncbi:hypothetical protein NCS52_01519500 [Fusarium sp. LHS14.1]|nr:hypothetical protein NCS52_01519500 [Fusarium sp. LHS14.1]